MDCKLLFFYCLLSLFCDYDLTSKYKTNLATDTSYIINNVAVKSFLQLNLDIELNIG